MKKMERPKLKVLRFENEDVIAASGVVTLAGFKDGTGGNATFSVGGQKYGHVGEGVTPWPSDNAPILSAFRTLGLPDEVSPYSVIFSWGGADDWERFANFGISIRVGGDEGGPFSRDTNGDYIYTGQSPSDGLYYFVKQ